jgi:predicted HD phosphohydrolase
VEDYNGTLARSPEKEDSRSVLDEIVRESARQMLQAAIETEVTKYLERYRHVTDDKGHRVAVRNGYWSEREIFSGVGPLLVSGPMLIIASCNDTRKGAVYLLHTSGVALPVTEH